VRAGLAADGGNFVHHGFYEWLYEGSDAYCLVQPWSLVVLAWFLAVSYSVYVCLVAVYVSGFVLSLALFCLWLCSVSGFVLSLALFCLWLCSVSGFVLSLALFCLWLCSVSGFCSLSGFVLLSYMTQPCKTLFLVLRVLIGIEDSANLQHMSVGQLSGLLYRDNMRLKHAKKQRLEDEIGAAALKVD
jgi:hypothetical protein